MFGLENDHGLGLNQSFPNVNHMLEITTSPMQMCLWSFS